MTTGVGNTQLEVDWVLYSPASRGLRQSAPDQGAYEVHEVADGQAPAEHDDACQAPGPALDAPVAAGEEGVDDLSPDPLAVLTAAVSDLAGQLRAHHARAQARERVIDHLHDEVQRLKVGERSLSLLPVVTDLQHLRMDLLRQAITLPEQVSRMQAAELLESFALSVELTLERCGVVPIRPEVGAGFSPREHRAVKVLSTNSQDLHERIAEVVAEGYQDLTAVRVTVPARVHVWRWEPASDPVSVDATGSEQEEKAEDG
jgi:hypothetical protein